MTAQAGDDLSATGSSAIELGAVAGGHAIKTLFAGVGEGPLLHLSQPLSFWGGVDPESSRIIDVRHPQCGMTVGGTVLALPATIGSSSSSSVLLELIRVGAAPAAILLGRADAILVVGCLVARELGWKAPPIAILAPEALAALPAGRLRVAA